MQQQNQDIQNDLFPLALMFIIVFYLIFILPTQLLNKNKAYQELLEAKDLTIYYYDRANSLEDSVVSLNDYIDNQDSAIISLKNKLNDPELAKLIKIKDDLRGYSLDEKATGIAIGWTEGSFEEDPDHKDNGFTVGPCGVTEYHVEYLSELGIDRYSYASCIEIYKLYKDKHSGSKYEAIKSYKGIKENTYLIKRYESIRKRVLTILKD